tara:strand:- start:17 stop:172 length:156 start_codon:yes stop_codon:yes gene_type:complete
MPQLSSRYAGHTPIPKKILKITIRKYVYKFGKAETTSVSSLNGLLGYIGYH